MPYSHSMSLPNKHLLARAGALVALLLATTNWSTAQSRPADQDTNTTITSLESKLWKDIVRLGQTLPTTQPHEKWFELATQRREERLREIRAYLMLYPGGSHRNEAIRAELEELFELDVLRNADYDNLATRVSELLRNPPSTTAHAEAAYWNLVLQQTSSRSDRPPTTKHADGPPAALANANIRDACQDYLRRFPTTRYAPRLAQQLFTDALRRSDEALASQMVTHLGNHFPDHPTTLMVQGRWRRETTIGQPFELEFESATVGGHIDTRNYQGQVLLIVVWADFSPAAQACATAVEQFRRDHASAATVLGISLDPTPADLEQAAASLGINWPQYLDGRGWGHRFALRWGVDQIPLVFVLDRQGRLLGAASDEQWAALARVAIGPED